MAQIPPAAWLASAWFPLIVRFYWRALRVFWSFRGLTVTSWWRSPQANRDVGGDPESQHLFGLAWDIAPASTSLVREARAAGLTAVDEGSHVHMQLFPAGALARAGVRFPS